MSVFLVAFGASNARRRAAISRRFPRFAPGICAFFFIQGLFIVSNLSAFAFLYAVTFVTFDLCLFLLQIYKHASDPGIIAESHRPALAGVVDRVPFDPSSTGQLGKGIAGEGNSSGKLQEEPALIIGKSLFGYVWKISHAYCVQSLARIIPGALLDRRRRNRARLRRH